MKKSLIVALILGLSISACGASKNSGMYKEKVCSLLSTQEVTNLIGEEVNKGQRDTKHKYPNASSCIWTSAKNSMPRLILTYYLNASKKELKHYAPPQFGAQKDIIKKQNGTPNETITVATSDNDIYEVIVRSKDNAVLLMPLYLNTKGGSKKAKELINLANEVANRAKKEK